MTALISLELSIHFLLTAAYSEFGSWEGGIATEATACQTQPQTNTNTQQFRVSNQHNKHASERWEGSGGEHVNRCTPAISLLLFYNWSPLLTCYYSPGYEFIWP